jgi:hypothetical protein
MHGSARKLETNRSATERNGRKTLTTVQGIPSKFDHKKILKVIKKTFGMFRVPIWQLNDYQLTAAQPAMEPSSATPSPRAWER